MKRDTFSWGHFLVWIMVPIVHYLPLLYYLFDKSTILSSLWLLWSNLWYYCSVVDYYIFAVTQFLALRSLRCLREAFLSIIWFIAASILVDSFIYFFFLPIAVIPSVLMVLINHAGRYKIGLIIGTSD
jgi:hypothetical protein